MVNEIRVSFLEFAGKIAEEVYDPTTKESRFAVWDGNEVTYEESIEYEGTTYKPIKDIEAYEKGAVSLPSEALEYGSEQDLQREIKEHIHKYVDVSDTYETFASWYVLGSWVYDKFRAVSYLRLLGDTGCGKSRFIDVVGGLCYKPIRTSGATTPAPVYRLIQRWKGTLLVDEGDLRYSDPTNEIVKILNQGFEINRPITRCNPNDCSKVEFFDTFGPKIIATRSTFTDQALESRCLTERMVETNRTDIPFNLPSKFDEEQRKLRNKLLMFRLRMYGEIDPDEITKIDLGDIEPRLKQAFSSFGLLFSNNPGLMETFREFLENYNRALVEERAGSFTGQIVNTIVNLKEEGKEAISSKMIAERLEEDYGLENVSPQKVGKELSSLGIKTRQRKVEGKNARWICWDEGLMDKLKRRYVLQSEGSKSSKCINSSMGLGDYFDLDDDSDIRGPDTNATNATNDTSEVDEYLELDDSNSLEQIGHRKNWRVERAKKGECYES
jgi:hypothetical protein